MHFPRNGTSYFFILSKEFPTDFVQKIEAQILIWGQ